MKKFGWPGHKEPRRPWTERLQNKRIFSFPRARHNDRHNDEGNPVVVELWFFSDGRLWHRDLWWFAPLDDRSNWCQKMIMSASDRIFTVVSNVSKQQNQEQGRELGAGRHVGRYYTRCLCESGVLKNDAIPHRVTKSVYRVESHRKVMSGTKDTKKCINLK